MQAELLEVAAPLEAIEAPLHDDDAHAGVALARVCLDSEDHEIGVDAIGDEGLRPVDDIVVTVSDRARRHRGEVGTDAGLGHADGSDELTAGDAWQPALLLLLRAVLEEVGDGDVVVEREPEARRANAGHLDLLSSDGVEAEVRHATTAELLGDVEGEEAVAASIGEELSWDDARLVPLKVVRDDLVVHPRPEGLAELVVL